MKKALLFLLLAWAAPGWAAPAFGISPFKVQIVPETPSRNSQVFQLDNGGSEIQAIQIRVETWDIDGDGKESNQEDTTSFSVYPEQFVLQPRSSQAVRVTWKGEMPTVEKSYRLVAEQLPVDFDPQATVNGIRFLLSYRAALYVTPNKAVSDVSVESFRREGDQLEMVLVNKGNAHTLLNEPTLTVTQGDGSTKKLDAKNGLEELVDRNIHAGGRLKVQIGWPVPADSDVKALKLEFTPAI